MEEISNVFSSRTLHNKQKINQKFMNSYKNVMKLQNRIKILNRQKQKKAKTIQKALKLHQKHISIKLQKSNRRQLINSRLSLREKDIINQNQNNKHMREAINLNIRTMRSTIRQKNRIHAHEVKYKNLNIKTINQLFKQKQQQTNQVKRLKVRIKQIEAKQNIANFWVRKINTNRAHKNLIIEDKLKDQKINKYKMKEMQKAQNTLLNQIWNTQKLQCSIYDLIRKERSMDAQQISTLYNRS